MGKSWNKLQFIIEFRVIGFSSKCMSSLQYWMGNSKGISSGQWWDITSRFGETSIHGGFEKEHDDSPGDLVAYFQTIARSDLSIYSALILLNRKAWRKLRDLPLLAHNFFRNTSTNEGSNN